MTIKSQITISQPIENVWKFVADHRNWEKWWAKLKDVQPRWQPGATLIWERGQSVIGNLVPQSFIEIPDPFMTNTFRFKSLPDGKTLVELEMTPRGGSAFSDGGLAQKAENDVSLKKLKEAIEEPSFLAEKKRWWQFWKSESTDTKDRTDSEIDRLIIALNDKENWEVTRSAALALGQLGDIKAVEPLIKALREKDARYDVIEVITALGQLRDPHAVEPLITAFNDKNSPVRVAIVEALERIAGHSTVDQLITALQNTQDPIRSGAAWTLGRFYDLRVVEPLIAALKDGSRDVRCYATVSLGEVGDERAVLPLIEILKDEYDFARGQAAHALGQICSRLEDVVLRARAIESLITALRDLYFQVRRYATNALGKIGDVRAVKPLETALQDEDKDVQKFAAEALENIQRHTTSG